MHLVSFVLSFLAVALIAAIRPAPALAGIKLNYTETSLGKLAAGHRDLFFSPDGKRVAYPVKRKDGWVVIVDGKESKQYEWVLAHTIVFSPDSKRVGYVIQRGSSMRVVIDDVEGEEYREAGRPFFSPDGRVAYLAKKSAGNKSMVIMDGQPLGEYENPRGLHFSPDGKHFAFAIDIVQRKEDTVDKKRAWVIDGKAGPVYDSVGILVFSADGSRWAHMAERGGKQCQVIDGKEGKEYERVGVLVFSPDAKRYAYPIERHPGPLKKEFLCVVDGAEGLPYTLVSEPTFSPDSKRVAYIVQANKIYMAVIDNVEGPGHDRVGEVFFSGDGKHVAYRTMDERRYRVQLDGKESKDYDKIGTLVMSDDGSTFAFAAKQGSRDFLVLNGKELDGAGFITLSPDGKYIVHTDDTPLTSVLMVNEVRGREYDGFLAGSRCVFTAPNKFMVMAGRKGEILRVEVEIVEE